MIPSKSRRAKIDRLVRAAFAKQHRARPRFLPSDTTEIDFSLVAIDGAGTGGSTPFDFSILTPPNGSDCSAVSGGWSCSVTEPAPVAQDSYTIVACSGTTGGCTGGSAVRLSETYATITVLSTGTTPAAFTLNPIVGAMSWNVGNIAYGAAVTNGSAAPSWGSVSGYTCASACWDPLLNNHGVALNDTLSLTLADAKGETIIPASGGGNGSGSPNVPIYLTPSGTLDAITVACNDHNVAYLNSTAGPAPTPAPTASPSQTTLANGFLNGAAQATNTTITSPVTGSDGSSGTVLAGSTATVYGNDGKYVNYDGAGSTYTPTSVETCTASDSNSLTATYYFGFAAGS